MNEGVQEKINNLSMLEQNTQQLSAQRQSFQSQLLEIDSALDELQNSKDAYRIIGSIMVRTDAAKLRDELDSKKKVLELRILSIEKQEQAARDKSKKLQEEIMAELDNSKKDAQSPSSKEKRKHSHE